MTEEKRNQNKEGSEVKIFPVPFSLEETEENIYISTSNSSKLSKDKIINQAYKFHSQGNILEAA